jgi:hypothetical protein
LAGQARVRPGSGVRNHVDEDQTCDSLLAIGEGQECGEPAQRRSDDRGCHVEQIDHGTHVVGDDIEGVRAGISAGAAADSTAQRRWWARTLTSVLGLG